MPLCGCVQAVVAVCGLSVVTYTAVILRSYTATSPLTPSSFSTTDSSRLAPVISTCRFTKLQLLFTICLCFGNHSLSSVYHKEHCKL